MAAKPPADASPSLHLLGRGREHFPAGVRPAEPPRWGEEPGWRSDPKPRDGWVNREGGGDWRALDPRGGDEWRVDRWKHSPAPVPGDGELGVRGLVRPGLAGREREALRAVPTGSLLHRVSQRRDHACPWCFLVNDHCLPFP